ncbi:MAG: tetratricopeptide repeat protein, partial [Terracidiphilus sp.]
GGFAVKHHRENPDCVECHMARPPSNDIAHEQVTDHWIRREVSEARLAVATTGPLVAVGGARTDDRDLGLADAQMAARGDEAAGHKAMELLARAEKASGGAASDAELHEQLGFLKQMHGDASGAAAEYKQALAADRYDATAAGDLAVLDVRTHEIGEAVRLWGQVLAEDPAQRAAGMDLAMVECAEGNREGALKTLERLLEFAPDDGKVRALASEMRERSGGCGGK